MTSRDNLFRIRDNIQKMADKGASGEEIDSYAKEEGVTPEQIKALPPSSEAVGPVSQVGSGFNKTLVDILDAPYHAGRIATNLLMGQENPLHSDSPIHSKEGLFKRGADYLNLIPEPQNRAERIGHGTGGFVGDALPITGGIARMAMKKGIDAIPAVTNALSSTFSRIRQQIMAPYRAGKGYIPETAAAVGGGLAESYAKEEGAGIAGQMAAGLSGALGVGAGFALGGEIIDSAAGRLSQKGLSAVRDYMSSRYFPWTDTGSEVAVSQGLKRAARGHMESALKVKPRKETFGDIPFARQTDSPGLRGFHQKILEQQDIWDESIQVEMNNLRSVLDSVGTSTGGAKQALSKRVAGWERGAEKTASTRLVKSQASLSKAEEKASGTLSHIERAMELRMKQAALKAMGKKVTPDITETQASSNQIAEIQRAVTDIEDLLEKPAWAAVNGKDAVSTKWSLGRVNWMKNNLPQADKKHMPHGAVKILEELGPNTTVAELRSLRSDLLEISRVARSNGQNRDGAAAEMIADAILKDLSSAPSSPALTVARGISARKAEITKRGFIGRVLGTAREGGPDVDPNLALKQTIGRGGPEAETTLQEFDDLFQMASQAGSKARASQSVENVSEYLRNEFVKNPKKVMREYGEILSRPEFSKLKNQFDNAIKADDVLGGEEAYIKNVAAGRKQKVEAYIQREREKTNRLREAYKESKSAAKSKTQKTPERVFAEAPEGEEWDSILKLPDSINAAKRLTFRTPINHKSDLRSTFVEYLTRVGPGEILENTPKSKRLDKIAKIVMGNRYKTVRGVAEEWKLLEQTPADIGNALNIKMPFWLEFAASLQANMMGSKVASSASKMAGLGSGSVGPVIGQSARFARFSMENVRKFIMKKPHRLAYHVMNSEEPTDFLRLLRRGEEPKKTAEHMTRWLQTSSGSAFLQEVEEEE